MKLDFGLEGSVAVVTGGTDGIGREIGYSLGMAGCRISICARSREKVDHVAKEFQRDGIEAFGVVGDCRNAHDVARIVGATVERFKTIDVLVNNVGGSAGIDFGRGDILTLTLDDVEKALQTNVGTAFLMSSEAFPYLSDGDGGSILNISSIASIRAGKGLAVYGAAKAALLSLTRGMAREWAPTVRVNALVVGHIATTRTQGMRSKADVADLESRTLLGRLGGPEDVAKVAVCVVSPLWSWVTGALIPVDGGALAK